MGSGSDQGQKGPIYHQSWHREAAQNKGNRLENELINIKGHHLGCLKPSTSTTLILFNSYQNAERERERAREREDTLALIPASMSVKPGPLPGAVSLLWNDVLGWRIASVYLFVCTKREAHLISGPSQTEMV